MANTTFDRPDLSAFTGLDGLGVEVMGQRIESDHAVLACRITGEDRWCRRCGCQGEARDTVIRRLAHVPCEWRPMILHVSVRRYRCPECAHVWRHTPYGDKYVNVILDVTPIRDRCGPSRLLDMVPGRSKRVFKTWLASRPTRGVRTSRSSRWMDSPGLRAPPLKNSPARGRSWIPSVSCALPGMLSMSVAGASGKTFTTGAGVPRIPCTRLAGCLRTRSCLLTPRQQHQILVLFASDCHVALEVTWSVYQNIIDAYRDPNKIRGKAMMQAEINTLTSTRVPKGLSELITLGRTLKRRSRDILAYFDHPHTSNGPTEAINGRLEHLRGSALGFAKPHQLHHPSTPRNRRIQTPTTPPIMKSP